MTPGRVRSTLLSCLPGWTFLMEPEIYHTNGERSHGSLAGRGHNSSNRLRIGGVVDVSAGLANDTGLDTGRSEGFSKRPMVQDLIPCTRLPIVLPSNLNRAQAESADWSGEGLRVWAAWPDVKTLPIHRVGFWQHEMAPATVVCPNGPRHQANQRHNLPADGFLQTLVPPAQVPRSGRSTAMDMMGICHFEVLGEQTGVDSLTCPREASAQWCAFGVRRGAVRWMMLSRTESYWCLFLPSSFGAILRPLIQQGGLNMAKKQSMTINFNGPIVQRHLGPSGGA
ncbi:hypothetical protein B0T21DRAFT_348218 [Apiosordaria backusii]|uniref:Uncharacterized protein n=1 Tax=Apiosordaria backusii TaxID=314023 RepID=A0AA40EG05_9PEZI|nr:hypothetical protein B0T21DRAFT_348218 [Apiosordaria backusii]